jgi:crossover junction endodeoxyribonuclease RuvC
MKILALDVSSTSTGWFVTKRSCGLIQPPATLSFEEKLVYFRRKLVKLLERYKPEVVVLEDTYFLRNIHTLKALAKFGGVAAEACTAAGCEVVTITATEARKHCCGKHDGKFKKQEVFDFFKKRYGLDDWSFEESNDITDAMALLWGYRGLIKAKNKPAKKKGGTNKKGK